MLTHRLKALYLFAAIVTLSWTTATTNAQTDNPPRTAADYYQRGVATDRTERGHEDAVNAFREAVRLDPKHEAAQSRLALTLMRLGKFEDARNSLQEAVKALPNSARLHRQLAEAEMACGNEDAALDEIAEARRLDPTLPGTDLVVAGANAKLGRFDEAQAALLRALEADANNPQLHFQLGMLYAVTKWWDQSISAFQRVLALAPNFPAIHQTLAAVYSDAGRTAEAIAELRLAIRQTPGDWNSYFLLGRSLREVDDREGALAAFLRSNEIKPLPLTAYSIGDLLELKGNHERAVPFLRTAAQGLPNERSVLASFAKALINLGRHDEAITPLKRLVQLQPGDADALANLGNNYMSGGHYDEAISALAEAARLTPQDEVIQMLLRVATYRKEIEANLPAIRSAVAADPKNPEGHIALARRLSSLRRFEEAEAEYLEALRLDPNNGEYENALAVSYTEAAQPAKAVPYYQRAGAHKPHHVIFLSLGSALEQLGRLDEAITAYRRSIELKPTFAMSLLRLGIVFDALNRLPEAIEVLRQALQAEPTNVFALHTLGQVYYRTGDKTAAMQQYHILKNLDATKAADLLRIISR